jgi:hypothetical protein
MIRAGMAALKRKLLPRTPVGKGLFWSTMVVVLFASCGTIGFLPNRQSGDVVPYCNGKPMQRTDVCYIFDSGTYTYDQMVAREEQQQRGSGQNLMTLLEVAVPLAAVLGAITFLVERQGRRRGP